jgi:pyrroline-5-carboxylate reductase
MTTLGFIGVGNMGSALLKGLAASNAAKNVQLCVYDSAPDKRSAMEAAGFCVCGNENEIAKNCKYIVLACKPQQLSDLLSKLRHDLTPETVLISLCAGINADFIRERTNPNTKIALVMPNMPMLLGAGSSALAYDDMLTGDEAAFVKVLLESCGIAEVIPLDKMNEVICLNASSPALIYYFAKCFVDYGASQGIGEQAALSLFAQSLAGSAKMLTETNTDIQALIDQVTSKGGTTLAALDALKAGGFAGVIRKACEACTKRAYELGTSV